jgi:hypothetical protein
MLVNHVIYQFVRGPHGVPVILRIVNVQTAQRPGCDPWASGETWPSGATPRMEVHGVTNGNIPIPSCPCTKSTTR